MGFIKKHKFHLLLGVIWLVSIFIVNPIAETPLNDDWAYARSVFELLGSGKYVQGNWPAMTLIAQIYIAAVFTKIFGFSFTVLRISTLIISLLGILFFFDFSKKLSKSNRSALFFSLLLLFNPLYFSLSFTFMTDIYFLTFLILSFYYFYKSLSNNYLTYLIVATVFTLIATLIRQPGVFIIMAWLPLSLLNKNISLKHKFGYILSLLVTILTLFMYQSWFKASFPTNENFGKINTLFNSLKTLNFNYLVPHFLTILLYPSLFFTPISFILFDKIKELSTKEKFRFLSLLVLFFVLLSLVKTEFPIGNIFNNLWLGPKLLKDGQWNENISPVFPNMLWLTIKYVAILNLSYLTSLAIVHINKENILHKWVNLSAKEITTASFIIFALGFTFFLILNPIFFDRYTLPLFPILLLILITVLPNYTKTTLKVAYVSVGIFAVFSISATQDYIAWNRAAMQAFTYLNNNKITKDKIDAGFAINGWYQSGPLNPRIKNEKSWWWVSDDEYVVSFGLIKGFTKEKAFPYYAMLKLNPDSIFILSHKAVTALPYNSFPLICDMETTSHDKNYFLSKNANKKFEKGFLQSDKKVFSGKYSVCLTAKEPFALLSRYKELKANEKFIVSVWRYGENIDAGIVLSSDMNEELFFYESSHIINRKDGWVQLELKFIIPENQETKKIGIFLWNKSAKNVWFDKLVINRKLTQENLL